MTTVISAPVQTLLNETAVFQASAYPDAIPVGDVTSNFILYETIVETSGFQAKIYVNT